jgi:predicted choloylglycine hydrolase
VGNSWALSIIEAGKKDVIRKQLRRFLWMVLLLLNGIVYTYHVGVFPRRDLSEAGARELQKPGAEKRLARWIDKKTYGMHQLVLSGSPYFRGLNAGELTQSLLQKQEVDLVDKLRGWVPSGIFIQGLILIAINWFDGIQNYFEPWATAEMYGVSQSAPKEFDYLADGFTRQIAYHGLHEVGQLMVDQKGDNIGCTVVATPYHGSWILGRNFDFEGGRVFDEDKILKWVFPDQGNAYVSVIWAGMVGAVTGVNERGLYISMNAAGTTDFQRLGTPSTLVLLKALQFSQNLDEAMAMIEKEQMFITDIFVLLDAPSGRMVRIEKSPLHTEVLPLTSPVIVTNHLVSERWQKDTVNLFRKNELTSMYRESRGRHLVAALDAERLTDPRLLETKILAILRDKGEEQGQTLTIANRRAIDPLIATHSVIYDAPEAVLYVGQGPSVAGRFTGFDLRASFQKREPVMVRFLDRDPSVSDVDYAAIHRSEAEVSQAADAIKHGHCDSGERHLENVAAIFQKHSDYLAVRGDLEACRGRSDEARKYWMAALKGAPAYLSEVRKLEEKIK